MEEDNFFVWLNPGYSKSSAFLLSTCLPGALRLRSFLPCLILLFFFNVCGFLFFHDLISVTQLRSCSNCFKGAISFPEPAICSASIFSGYESKLISLRYSECNLEVHLPCLLPGACCEPSHPSQISISVVINTQKHL